MSKYSAGVSPKLWFFFFFILVFVTQYSVKSVDYEGRVVDFQVMARLSVYALLFFIFRRYLFVFVNDLILRQKMLFAFFLYMVGFAIFSFDWYAIYSLATNLLALFFVYVFWTRVGSRLFYWYFFSVALFSAISLFYYYYDPEIGRYSYWMDGVFSQSGRLQGVSGHPNTLGFMICSALLCYVWGEKNRFMTLVAVFLFFCLFMTNSRTNLMSLFFLSGFIVALKYRRLGFYCGSMFLFLVAAFALLNIFPDIFSVISRTGDVDEIFTLTGRSAIWDFVFYLILDKPVFGWGYGVASKVLSENSDYVGFVVGQTHNLYLQVLLVSGVFGGALFLLFFMRAIHDCYRLNIHLGLAFLISILVVGFSEAIIFNTIANNAFIVFSLAVVAVNDGLLALSSRITDESPRNL